MSFSAIRPRLIWIHRWIGIVLAPVFLLIILSGAVLSFRPVVDDFAARSAGATRVDVPALGALVRTLEASGTVRTLTVADGGRSVDVVSSAADSTGRWEIASASRTGASPSGPGIFQTAESLHKSLLLGLGLVVEAASYAMLAIMLAGPLLAWLRFRNTLIGWHTALGWCLLPVTIASPVTAVLMTLGVGGGQTPLPKAEQPVTMSQVFATPLPEVDLSHLETARSFRGGTVLVQVAGETGGTFVVTDKGATALTGGPGLVKEIHEGTWAGAWSGGLNFLVSLALLGLTVTGFVSWFRRWRRDRGGALAAGADILLVHASQTGTAARLAAATLAALEQGGERVALAPLGTVPPAELRRFRLVLLIAATTGEGDVPDGARHFLKSLQPGAMAGVRFAVLGLGDRSYAHFCGGAETLRSALLAAGGSEALPMACADGDPGPAWVSWLEALRADLGLRCASSALPATNPTIELILADRHRMDDPAQGETQETWAITLESAADLSFRPGDLLRVTPGEGERERPYSIGSSCRVDPRLIELTVRLHHWRDAQGQEGFGRVSGLLIRTMPVGGRLSARVDPHPAFNPPDDPSCPIIMVGAGSGVAPFPGFLSERKASGRPGPAWLLFGNRHRDGDFLWEERFEAALRDGSLTRLDTAFSRDADDGVHIQERLKEAAAEVVDWLMNKKAVVYICGRREMARGVEEALAGVLVERGGYSPEAARDEIDRWAAEARIRVDAFD
ncbi:PepSY domain-containing protein [Azorhizobium doebereinerae]|uniref:PepSY domain-containing protein n=1 Tax=Azorhizobium doebereinerae TaxID=281091 RepID=UPI0004164B9D|nr:PepSY domain-containing protein [Azorhizobium doebereinerae]